MKQLSPNEIEAIIDQLDGFIKQGYEEYNHQRLIFQGFQKGEAPADFDVGIYYNNALKALTDWYVDTQLFMQGNLPSYYHLVHFILPQPSAVVRQGMSPNLSNLFIQTENRLRSLEEIIIRFEGQRNLSVRQEIAEKEYAAGVLYKITYTDHSREIKMNDIVIAKPDFAKENEQFFSYVFQRPNTRIARTEIEGAIKINFAKTNTEIVTGLGFTGPLRKVFWSVSKTHVQFNNPITKQYALENELSPLNLADLAKRFSEVERGTRRPRRT